MQVLKGTALDLDEASRCASIGSKHDFMRGGDASLPDLVCGSCGAVLVIGIPAEWVSIAIACTRCGAVNEAAARASGASM